MFNNIAHQGRISGEKDMKKNVKNRLEPEEHELERLYSKV